MLARDKKVFCDLKFFDIPATVGSAVRQLKDRGASFVTVHGNRSIMEAAAENNKTFVVLDRPNPINGVSVEGSILEPEYSTFVGLNSITVRHGMTVGELATMFNKEGWLKNGVKANLKVIPLDGWQRDKWFDETGLIFRKPSPNMPHLETATVYPGLCLIEGINVSEGRGTHNPFLQFGAPWIDSIKITEALNNLNLPGITFEAHNFTPVSIPGMSTNPKDKDQLCTGVRLKITNRDQFEPYWTGIQIVRVIQEMYPDSLKFRTRHFDRLCGTADVREAIETDSDLLKLRAKWQTDLDKFLKTRKKYLLY